VPRFFPAVDSSLVRPAYPVFEQLLFSTTITTATHITKKKCRRKSARNRRHSMIIPRK